MKKNLPFALLIAALPFVATSCSNEDDLPNVDYSVEITGALVDQETGTIYVAQGDTLNIESITVKNLDSDKNAGITGAEYFWDYNFIGNSPFAPYGYKIYVSDETPLGEHALTIRMGVVAVDKEPAVGIVNYNVQVIPNDNDAPSTAAVQPLTKTLGFKN